MMLKKKTNPLARLKVLLMVPLAVGMLYAFAHPSVEKTMDELQQGVDDVVEVQDDQMAMLIWKRVVERKPYSGQDREFLKTIQFKQSHTILLNKYNQLMCNGVKFPANFSEEKVAKKVADNFYEQWKYFNQLGENYKPQLFNVQSDRSTDIKAIVKVTDALAKGYDQAINKIAKELNVSYAEFSRKCPLLLVLNNSFALAPPPVKNIKKDEIVEIVEEEMPKQCHIEALASDDKGMCMAVNFPIEVLREFLKPERQSLINVSSFSMYLGESYKVKTEKVTEVRNLLRFNTISKLHFPLRSSRLKVKNSKVVYSKEFEEKFGAEVPPLPKQTPSVSDFESWKNASQYGVWIDGKRVANTRLSQYKNTDFSQYFVSKLEKNAKNYGKHYFQVDLMTHAYYQKYLREQESRNIPSIYPLKGTAIKNTSEFGMRMDPVLKVKKVHTGMDFATAEGTSVIATAKGVVVSVMRSDKGFGNKIVIKHNETYQTAYAHLQSIIVKEDQQVAKGQIIGTVGNTGVSTAPHLHYEVVKDGQKVNPRDYMPKL